ncbi:MAG: hypothetical protein CM15mP52_2790 [Candidatus Neomarinimicrobiota bacterium]|nr:MAG: hypothetical protein CM15mP52_2790 [Candidatus Neomarinimicrobiota bacterium]
MVPSAGISLKFRTIVMEYGYESHPYLEPTHRISFALQLSPAVVSITKTTIAHNPIFRSLHRYYESEPFIKVGLKNISDKIYQKIFFLFHSGNPHQCNASPQNQMKKDLVHFAFSSKAPFIIWSARVR